MTKSNLSFPDFGGYVLLLLVFLFFSNIILLLRIGDIRSWNNNIRKTIKAILPHKDYRLFCLYLSLFAFKYPFYVFNKRWIHSLKMFLLFFKNAVYCY